MKRLCLRQLRNFFQLSIVNGSSHFLQIRIVVVGIDLFVRFDFVEINFSICTISEEKSLVFYDLLV